MLELPDVTLVALYNVCHELTLQAVDECTRRVKFGDVKLFTDRADGQGFIKAGPFASAIDANYYMIGELPKYIKTRHALFVQWDSWVVNPEAWQSEFLDYDYIGAPWWYPDKFNVGNGGFSMRSKKLMDFLADHPDEFPVVIPEDQTLCRHYQPRLTQFRWAPTILAGRFSFERVMLYPARETFGFHGVFNWPTVLSGRDLSERVAAARTNAYVRGRPEYLELSRLVA